MARWIYQGDSPGQLVDGEVFIDVSPGEEFDAPDGWTPEPSPHPLYKPVTARPRPTQASEE